VADDEPRSEDVCSESTRRGGTRSAVSNRMVKALPRWPLVV